MLSLRINGKDVQVDSGTTLAMLVAQKGLHPQAVIVEYNHVVVRQNEWHDIMLKSGDSLEIVAFIGGG